MEYFEPDDTEPGKFVGLLKKNTLPDGGTHSYQYDKNWNRTQLDLKIAGISWNMNYEDDPLNRKKSVNVTIPSMVSETIGETYTSRYNGLLKTVKREGYSQNTLTH